LIPGSKIKPNLPMAPAKKHSKVTKKPNATKVNAKPSARPSARLGARPKGKPVRKGPQEVTQTKEADVTLKADQSIDNLWREFNAVISPDLVEWPKSMI